MYEDRRTGQLLPILIGTTMLDEFGTDMEVPILSAERDKNGNMHPLGGTTEDPDGRGKLHLIREQSRHKVKIQIVGQTKNTENPFLRSNENFRLNIRCRFSTNYNRREGS